MLVTLEMVSENINISFKVFGKREGNILTFPDKSVPNTTMKVYFDEDMVEIVRVGNVNMKQSFVLNQKEFGYYKNDLGMEFKLASFTREMTVTENSIELIYDHYLEDEWQSRNKLKIIF